MKLDISNIKKNPFYLFFPLAIAFAIYAAFMWIDYVFFKENLFPVEEHAMLFIGGYIYLSMFGFLMTAIPKFTETPHASNTEIAISILLIFLLFISTIIKNNFLYWIFNNLGWIFLLTFIVKRFLKRKQNIPHTFSFISFGIISGILGSTMMAYSLAFESELHIEHYGKIIIYDAMVLSFLLGVGGRIIPGILGLKEDVKKQRNIYEQKKPFIKVIPYKIIISLLIFIISFIIEITFSKVIGFLLRAIAISYIAIYYWRIFKKPAKFNYSNILLISGCWFITIASWVTVFIPDYDLAIKHLIYICGYILITFLVSNRVTLAHSKADIAYYEKKSFPYIYIGLIIILAGLTRTSADFVESYDNHLGYAAIFLFIAMIIWIFYYLSRMIRNYK